MHANAASEVTEELVLSLRIIDHGWSQPIDSLVESHLGHEMPHVIRMRRAHELVVRSVKDWPLGPILFWLQIWLHERTIMNRCRIGGRRSSRDHTDQSKVDDLPSLTSVGAAAVEAHSRPRLL